MYVNSAADDSQTVSVPCSKCFGAGHRADVVETKGSETANARNNDTLAQCRGNKRILVTNEVAQPFRFGDDSSQAPDAFDVVVYLPMI